jgi:hypothetical protein
MKLKTLPIVALLAFFASSLHAAEPVTKAEAQAFFKRMGELILKSDQKYLELYADDARISGHNHETGETTTATGAQWKQLVALSQLKAKKRDERSSFSKARYTPVDGNMKINAERYAIRKCNTDPDYYLVLGRQPDGRILIVEESFELKIDSLCKE